jgi:mannose/fructose/N-acetylgalactosamine-specific phosphotransferase system component IIB
MLALIRIDDRLIHGQVMAVWVRRLGINRIVVIDDDSAADPFANQLMHLAMPAGVTLSVHLVNAGAAALAQIAVDHTRTLVLFRTVEAAVTVNREFRLAHVNVGNLAMRAGRTLLWRTVAVTPAELQALRTLESDGVKVYLQMVPTDPQRPLSRA